MQSRILPMLPLRQRLASLPRPTLFHRGNATLATPRQPLTGLRVLDMSRVLAGPYCAQILGDLGAEVIKIEHPTRGDDTRAWGPPYAPYLDGRSGQGESAYYLSVNRNKKSLALSFKEKAGVDIITKLVKNSDVLVENYLPGSLKKYGLDYESLAKINPKLIYASITGYGQTGPYSDRAGYDVMVEAEMGLMHITGPRDGPPVKVGVAVTDLTTGLYAVNSVLAAIIERGQSGQGQHLDVCLSDCQVATLSNMAQSVLVTGKRDGGRYGTSHPSVVPYRAFRTSDGDILIGGANDRLFGVLCNCLGKPEWASDERFSTNSSRVANREVLEKWIEDATKSKTTQEWLDIFEGTGLPYAKVNDLKDTLNHPHVTARGMVKELDHPALGKLKVLNSPVQYSRTGPSIRTPPPLLGQHTKEVLAEVLGLDAAEIKQLEHDQVAERNAESGINTGGVAGISEVSIGRGEDETVTNDSWAKFYADVFQTQRRDQKLAILTGASAGATESIVVVPFELVKIRLQDKSSAARYKGVLDCAVKIIRESGPLGLYQGFESTVWRHIVWNAGYFGCIFQVRSLLPTAETKKGTMVNDLVAGSVGGTVGTLLNTPFDVVKSRIQSTTGAKESLPWVWSGIFKVYREEGVAALYKGLVPKVVRFAPGGGIMLVVYSFMIDLLTSGE
ncbi:Mitochondrial thiamine pyrophosphate carrier 1 [Fusarium keratoplasticum]|nr:Mitochondrial thiamine pyrophosphate carrier 1 [Fusarium keratoplasticum]